MAKKKGKFAEPSALAKLAQDVPSTLLNDVRRLIESARVRAAVAVNSELVWLYWQVGNRVREDLLEERRAEYGMKIVSALSRQLTLEYGSGFSEKTLRHMIRFAEVFPDGTIVSALRRQLSWTHLRQIIYLKDPLQREFYSEMCRIERWSTRTLERKIRTLLFERTAVSRKPEELIEQELKNLRDDDQFTPDLVFRDPYLLRLPGPAR
jgi:ParB-like chromosome segregation protein Spo0J